MKSYSTGLEAYPASKTLAHLAGTRFMAENKPQFDLIRILPGYVQGANELYRSAEEMRDMDKVGSNEGVMGTAIGRVTGQPRFTMQVLLDNVAKAHVLALDPKHGKDGNNLLLVSSGGDSVPWKEAVRVIERLCPEAIQQGVLVPKAEDPEITANFDVGSSEETLGFRFAGIEEMVRSVAGQYMELLAAA